MVLPDTLSVALSHVITSVPLWLGLMEHDVRPPGSTAVGTFRVPDTGPENVKVPEEPFGWEPEAGVLSATMQTAVVIRSVDPVTKREWDRRRIGSTMPPPARVLNPQVSNAAMLLTPSARKTSADNCRS